MNDEIETIKIDFEKALKCAEDFKNENENLKKDLKNLISENE